MGRSRILTANWYDYPQYYDIAFQAYTLKEANFIEAACRKYCPFGAQRLLEPGCGSGRLIMQLAARGYQMTGFDHSRRALSYLRRRLRRRRLRAEIFEAEMTDFEIGRPVDAAYCPVNTFRYLLTDQAARGHLKCIATSLRPGGIYVLGFHLLPPDVSEPQSLCWTEQRGQTRVTVTLRLLRPDLRRRVQQCGVDLLVRRGAQQLHLRHEFEVRTYTARQFSRLVDSVPSLELCDVYDFRYDISHRLFLNNEMAYAVFVVRRRLPS